MKFRIFLDGELSIRHLSRLSRKDFLHLCDLFLGSVSRSARGRWRFQHLANIQKLAYQLPLANEDVGDRVNHSFGGHFRNHGADALPWFDESEQFQAADGISNRAAA